MTPALNCNKLSYTNGPFTGVNSGFPVGGANALRVPTYDLDKFSKGGGRTAEHTRGTS